MELICFCLHKYCFIVPPWDQQEQTLIFSHHLKIYDNIPAFSIIMIIYLLLDNHGAAKVKQLSSLILFSCMPFSLFTQGKITMFALINRLLLLPS